MDQERSLRMQPLTAPPPSLPNPLPLYQGILLTPQPPALQETLPHLSCTLPIIPPPILTPTMPLASAGIRLSTQPSSNFMLPSAFQGEGIEVNKVRPDQIPEHPQKALQALQVVINDPASRTVTFQDSCDITKPSTSKGDVLEMIHNH